jgi:membrane protease YdiL (CAAX protease family)
MLSVAQPWGALLAGLLAGATVCLPGALGEELAWRGYLQREVQHLGFWRASLVVALAWIGWHLPPYLLAGEGIGISINLLMTTPLIVFIRNRGGSVCLLLVLLAQKRLTRLDPAGGTGTIADSVTT